MGNFQVSADGARVVYLADEIVDETFELFAVKPGASPVRLNPPFTPGMDVRAFRLSPDGHRVVYVANPNGPFELFSVPTDGGIAVRLAAQPVPVGLPSFQIDAERQQVVFLAQPTTQGEFDLYRAPLDGGAPAVPLTSGERILRFVLGSERVVFQVVRTGQGSALFSAPLDGVGANTTLTPFQASTNLTFELTPDGRRLLYLSGNLFAIPVDGRGGAVDLSGSFTVQDFRISANGKRSVYRRSGRGSGAELVSVSVFGDEAPIPLGVRHSSLYEVDPESGRVLFTDAADQLFSLPILGGATPTPISAAGSVVQFQPLKGGRVFYVEDLDPTPGFPNTLVLASASTQGGAVVNLAEASINRTILEFLIARDHVCYRSLSPLGSPELFSVPLDGSRASVRMHAPLGTQRAVRELTSHGFAASADGSLVAFVADAGQDEAFELFAAPADASSPEQTLSGPLPIGPVEGDVSAARFDATGTRAVFLADAEEDEVYELFSAPTSGGAPPVKLNPPLPDGGDVLGFEVSAGLVVYRAFQETTDRPALYTVPIDGGTATRLSGALDRSVFVFQLTADGARVVFQRATSITIPDWELLSVAADASAAPFVLTTALGSSLTGQRVALSPHSDRAVFIADPDADGTYSLYSADLFSGARVLLDGLSAGAAVRDYQITPDAVRVIYRVQTTQPTALHLFSVPIDGTAAPVQLDAPLTGASLVTGFAVSADGARVAFSSDAFTTGVYELFAMPVDGSVAPRRLRTASAERLEISPDGTRVVFLAPGTPGRYRLASVPLDASAPAVPLTPTLVFDSGFTSRPFRITADSSRVVVRAAELGEFALASVPIDGTRPPVLLSRPNGTFATVRDDYLLTPDGRSVLYRIGTGPIALGSELFHVPVDGRREPVRISRRPTVYGFDLDATGTRVLHRTTQDSPGVIELYADSIVQPPRTARR